MRQLDSHRRRDASLVRRRPSRHAANATFVVNASSVRKWSKSRDSDLDSSYELLSAAIVLAVVFAVAVAVLLEEDLIRTGGCACFENEIWRGKGAALRRRRSPGQQATQPTTDARAEIRDAEVVSSGADDDDGAANSDSKIMLNGGGSNASPQLFQQQQALIRYRLLLFVVYAAWAVVVVVLCERGGPVRAAALIVHKYSTRVVRTRYGPLRGVVVHSRPPVEAYLGVPYATPPVGSLRYMPPVTPSQWRNTRLADRFSPVCPQRPPDISNRSEALLAHPRRRLLLLERLLPLLANQSEDCLYLNLFVPRNTGGTGTGAALEEDPAAQSSATLLPCLVFIHGESYEWNSGNPYDGTLLASTGGVIVVTINFRLGVLGFLKTGSKGSAQGNFGLMDLIAGLHWLRENLALFGGDPQRVTLMGHGTGAALANFIAASPVAKELVQRAILLSGSSTSPWAIQRDPLWVKRAVAEHTGCHGDLHDDDLAPCLRLKPLELLLTVRMDIPRFLPGFAPFVDGTLLVQQSSTAAMFQSSTSAFPEVIDFPSRDLLLGLTSCESYLDVDAQELRFGFDERRRDRILRTYVRNAFRYHLNEIFSALKNEYTDWERPTQNPLSVRDATLDVLSDGHTAAPLLRLAHRHAATLGTTKTFFMHFRRHESAGVGELDDEDFPLRSGSVSGEDVPYILGLPMIGGGSFFPYNYSRSDAAISKTLIRYVSNFIKKGDPNGAVPNASNADDVKRSPPESESSETAMPYWDTYDSINQFYLEIGNRPERKDHYRGHKMSLWLNLIPQLHRPGDGEDVSMRHHHFQEEDEQFYDGFVRPQSKQKPTISLVQVITPPPVPSSTVPTPLPPKSDTALQATTTECPPNGTHLHHHQQEVLKNPNNLLRKLATNYHYQNYTTALTITIAVGCFLLLLNVLIFAGIYHQRGRTKNNKRKQQDQLEVGMGSGTSSPSEQLFQQQKQQHSYEVQAQQQMSCKSCAMAIHDYIEKSNEEAGSPEEDAHLAEITLQQFSSSPLPGKRSDSNYPDVTSTGGGQPPPTSETQNHAGGILRPHRLPATPSQMKKRVQIQEISV